MDERDREMFDNEEFFEAVVRRYEDMLKKEKDCYFDVHEFEEIIDYYIENDEFQSAEMAVNIASQQHPGANSIKIKNAQLLIDEGKPFQALKLLNLLEKMESGNEEIFILKGLAYNILGNIKEAIRQFDHAISLADEDKDELLHNIGITFMNLQHFKLALKYLRLAYDIDTSNLAVIYDLGYCYERNNDFRKSLQFYNLYLDEEPYSEMVWYKIGGVYEKQELFDKAIEAYDYALAIDESYSLVYLNKANVYIRQNKFNEALDLYKEFIEMNDDYVEVYCNIGYCYEELGNLEEALNSYQQAIDIDPQYADAWYNISKVKLQQNNIQDSIQYMLKAVESETDNDLFLVDLAELYAAAGDKENASRAFEKALIIEQLNYEYWIRFSEVWYDFSDIDRAISILEESLFYHSDIARVNYYLAAYCFANNYFDKALKYFEQAFTINFEDFNDVQERFAEVFDTPKVKKLINIYIKNKL